MLGLINGENKVNTTIKELKNRMLVAKKKASRSTESLKNLANELDAVVYELQSLATNHEKFKAKIDVEIIECEKERDAILTDVARQRLQENKNRAEHNIKIHEKEIKTLALEVDKLPAGPKERESKMMELAHEYEQLKWFKQELANIEKAIKDLVIQTQGGKTPRKIINEMIEDIHTLITVKNDEHISEVELSGMVGKINDQLTAIPTISNVPTLRVSEGEKVDEAKAKELLDEILGKDR